MRLNALNSFRFVAEIFKTRTYRGTYLRFIFFLAY